MRAAIIHRRARGARLGSHLYYEYLVFGHGAVDLHSPGMHAARQITDLAKTMVLQEGSDVQTARAVMADTNDRGIFIEIVDAPRNRLHRHQGSAVELANLEFPLFAHIEQQGTRAGGISQPGGQLWCTQMLHRRLRTGSATAPLPAAAQHWFQIPCACRKPCPSCG